LHQRTNEKPKSLKKEQRVKTKGGVRRGEFKSWEGKKGVHCETDIKEDQRRVRGAGGENVREGGGGGALPFKCF